MAMLTLLDRLEIRGRTTVHGFRASFSTWANETGAARPDVVEACLAHRETDLVRAAYNRAGFFAERAALLRAWADFCEGEEPCARKSAPRRKAAVVPVNQRITWKCCRDTERRSSEPPVGQIYLRR
jgi:hypothetical protein